MKAQPPLKRSQGFALIATISVLLLLTMIAVAFLSLSAVSVRTARIDFAEQEARSNARLALMIALGELQREMGPDQRVSASASILDETPDTSDISSNVDHPHWTGIWSTNWAESSTGDVSGPKAPDTLTPWTRDNDEGGLSDRRFSQTWDRETAVSTYLVSGNEGGRARASAGLLLPTETLSEDQGGKIIQLVGSGSVIDEEDMVEVKTVEILREVRRPNGVTQEAAMGNYGYWVSDESAKAKISQPDRHDDENPSISGESGFQRVFHAQDVEVSAMTDWNELADGDAEKLVSVRSAQLAGIDEDAIKNAFHAVTTESRSVLANARDGGLQKDLAIPIVEDASVADLDASRLEYIGLDLGSEEDVLDGSPSGDRLIGPPNEKIAALMGHDYDSRLEGISPRFRIISNWLKLAKSERFSLSNSELDLSDQQKHLLPQSTNYGSPRTSNQNVWDGLLADPSGSGESSDTEDVYGVRFTKLDESTIAPILVEAGFYYNLATRNTGSDENPRYQLYIAMYPRVALWNPYNVEMTVPGMLCQMFVNGNKDVRIKFEGDTDEPNGRLFNLGFGSSRGGGDGNLWFVIADDVDSNEAAKPLTIGPGETIVCTPDLDRSKRTSERPDLRGNYSVGGDTLNNLLTPYNAESPHNYLLDELRFGADKFGSAGSTADRSPFKPVSFFEEGVDAQISGGDNFQFMLKDASSYSRVLLPEIQRAPMILAGSISLRAGGGDEDPVVWDSESPVPVYEFTSNTAGQPLVTVGGTADPDVRTRDGFRLRWYEENPANLTAGGGLGASEMEKLFQTSGIGNWNVRASYILRNPWDNISADAPFFFGNYTRDQFDDFIGWANTRSKQVGGKYTGFPFASASSSTYNQGPVVLFELPSEQLGIPNLAYLRNMKMSELAWAPTYAIGNSLADPRCEPNGTIPDLSLVNDDNNGWNSETIGINDQGSRGPEYWARLFREILMYQSDENHVVFDMSYEANYNLWDTYLISSGGPTQTIRDRQVSRFVDNPTEDPLPNGRYGLFSRSDLDTSATDDLGDFFRVAARLSLEGGFNVNSTSVDAWKALLSSTLGVSVGDSNEVIFPRHLAPTGATTENGGVTEDSLAGNRQLSDTDVEAFAEQIVSEVKKRAPFFGLSDFVNRRLIDDVDLARAGPIEVALTKAGINSSFESGVLSIEGRDDGIGSFSHHGISDAARLDHRLKPATKAWGLPGHLTQGDVLGVIGSSLTARGDTFKIRTYGESRDVNGKVLARAWCEATVQRTPEPMSPDQHGINPEPVTGSDVDFGRRFKIVGFRWLSGGEV